MGVICKNSCSGKNLNFPILIFLIGFICQTEIKADVYEDYIRLFSHLAIEQQEEFGIPASVTLAQGILESSAGRSRLATKGNNHFGIKCHKDWKGSSMRQDDDAPNECFRVYHSPEESYRDHSLFLKRDRYKPLFELDPTDYKGWALGLKKCGYATDPNYADRLITIIERYGLFTYDSALGDADETVMFIKSTLGATHRVRKTNGLHYIVALPDDTYESIAKELGMNVKKLMKYNDADKNTIIKPWEEIYLEEKNDMATGEQETAMIGEGETMRDLAQRYGIKLKKLKSINKSVKSTPGTVVKLK